MAPASGRARGAPLVLVRCGTSLDRLTFLRMQGDDRLGVVMMSPGTGNLVLGVAALGAVAAAVIAGPGPVSVLLLGGVVLYASSRLFASSGREDSTETEADHPPEGQ
jgi:hypothetical protein